MKALVAGGAGFLGSWLCDSLLLDGFEVVCVDNLITGNKANITQNLENPRFIFLNHDITKSFSASELVKITNVNIIFHLASPASPNSHSPKSYLQFPVETLKANSIGTYNLLELSRTANAKFLFASSSEVYGEAQEHPQNEKYYGNVNPIGPRSCYDEAKRFGEALVFAYLRKFNLDARVVRIFNTYGPRMDKDDGRVVSNFIMQLLLGKPLTVFGDGEQTRSFCYVTDLINGLRLAMASDKTKGEVFNLGNNEEVSINKLALLISNLLKEKPSIVYENLPENDPPKRKPDLSKINEMLGYEVKIDLEEGLKKTITYFQSL